MRSTRRYLGVFDMNANAILPKKTKKIKPEGNLLKHAHIGATHLLDQICDKTGLHRPNGQFSNFIFPKAFPFVNG
jgi:hypothetical protein